MIVLSVVIVVVGVVLVFVILLVVNDCTKTTMNKNFSLI